MFSTQEKILLAYSTTLIVAGVAIIIKNKKSIPNLVRSEQLRREMFGK